MFMTWLYIFGVVVGWAAIPLTLIYLVDLVLGDLHPLISGTVLLALFALFLTISGVQI